MLPVFFSASHRATILAVIAAGGALGSLSRYGLAVAMPHHSVFQFPWATFIVNISGAYLLAFVATHFSIRYPRMERLRLMIGTGFLGAYTTFSAFAVETQQLLSHRLLLHATVYVISTLVVGQLASQAGTLTARTINAESKRDPP